MNEELIEQIVQSVLARLSAQKGPVSPSAEVPVGESIPDITAVDLRGQYLVDSPKDGDAYLALKENTPARVGIGHAGARYRTATVLRFQADHAAAQDAVFSDVPQTFLDEMGLTAYSTTCQNRDEFLTRPDKGRVFSEETLSQIKKAVPSKLSVLVYLADGLSSTAVLSNAKDILPAIVNGLKGYGVTVGDPFFVRFGRVGSMDCLSEALSPDVICVLLGERPGLVTAKSMSAYIAYRPSVNMSESRRTVVANIHQGGTPPVEAGAFIVDLIRMMLDKKASGLDLPI